MKTSILLSNRRRSGGFTLMELLIALLIGTMTLAGVSVTASALRRAFEAADYRMTAQNDQLRALDYISRDLRMATTVAVPNAGAKLTLTLPPPNPGMANLNLGPVLSSLGGGNGGTTASTTGSTVSYYVEGGQLIREVSGKQTVIADTVAEVKFVPGDQSLTTSIVFTPQFSFSPTLATQENTRVYNCVYLLNDPAVK